MRSGCHCTPRIHAGTSRKFHGFDNAVRRVCRDAQSAPRIQNRLVMRAIDVDFAAPRHFGQVAALDLRRMAGVRFKFFVIVVKLRAQFAGNVLHQAAAKMHVERLDVRSRCREAVCRSPENGRSAYRPHARAWDRPRW